MNPIMFARLNIGAINIKTEASLHQMLIKDFDIPGVRQMITSESDTLRLYVAFLTNHLHCTMKVTDKFINTPALAALVVPEPITVAAQVSSDAVLCCMKDLTMFNHPDVNALTDEKAVGEMIRTIRGIRTEFTGLTHIIRSVQASEERTEAGMAAAANERVDSRCRIAENSELVTFEDGPDRNLIFHDVTLLLMAISTAWERHEWTDDPDISLL